MIRVAVIEDDRRSLAHIKDLLRRFEEENACRFEIVEYRDGDEIVENYRADYDFLLMDIELPLLSGMSAADGYRVGALDYLVKPVDYASFAETMKRALLHRRTRKDQFLMLNTRGGRQKVRIRSIRYVEVRDHDLTYHTLEGDIEIRGTFREAEQRLTPEGFFRCNKGLLINMEYVDGVDGLDVCMGSDRIRLGNNRKKAFMDALNQYMCR